MAYKIPNKKEKEKIFYFDNGYSVKAYNKEEAEYKLEQYKKFIKKFRR